MKVYSELFLLAQGAHAAVAAIAKSLGTESTKAYLNDLPAMHKIVLKANNEEELKSLVSVLQSKEISHYAWVEQPEDLLVAVASAPADKGLLSPHFKQFKLFK